MELKICSNTIAFHILLFSIYLFTTTNTQAIPPPKILKNKCFPSENQNLKLLPSTEDSEKHERGPWSGLEE